MAQAIYDGLYSPARPLEPFGAFDVSLGYGQLFHSTTQEAVGHAPFMSEPSSPAIPPKVYDDDDGRYYRGHLERTQSAPSCPTLDSWDHCHDSLGDGEFLSSQRYHDGVPKNEPQSPKRLETPYAVHGGLRDGEFFNSSQLSTRDNPVRIELEHDHTALGALSDGEFLGSCLRPSEVPSRPILVHREVAPVQHHDPLELQGTLSDGEFFNCSRRLLEMPAARAELQLPPRVNQRILQGRLSDVGLLFSRDRLVLLSLPKKQSALAVQLEQCSFHGSLSDGEFLEGGLRNYSEYSVVPERGHPALAAPEFITSDAQDQLECRGVEKPQERSLYSGLKGGATAGEL